MLKVYKTSKTYKVSKTYKIYTSLLCFGAYIFGLLASLLYFMNHIGVINHHFLKVSNLSKFILLTFISLSFSFIGLIALLISNTNINLAKKLMFIAAIGGILTIGPYYLLSTILFIISGLICLLASKNKLVQIY